MSGRYRPPVDQEDQGDRPPYGRKPEAEARPKRRKAPRGRRIHANRQLTGLTFGQSPDQESFRVGGA